MVTASRILAAGCGDAENALLDEVAFDLHCKLKITEDGNGCLSQLQRYQPHLVLLDARLVHPDAYELCRHIKNHHIAMVLIAAALNQLEDIDRACQAGTDDILSKPIRKPELRQRVTQLLALRDTLR